MRGFKSIQLFIPSINLLERFTTRLCAAISPFFIKTKLSVKDLSIPFPIQNNTSQSWKQRETVFLNNDRFQRFGSFVLPIGLITKRKNVRFFSVPLPQLAPSKTFREFIYLRVFSGGSVHVYVSEHNMSFILIFLHFTTRKFMPAFLCFSSIWAIFMNK